jgi:hypothetical protein
VVALMDHTRVHAPEHQTGRHVHRGRPACYVPIGPVGPRGEITAGWPDGVQPGMRNPFHGQGIMCGCAITVQTWHSLIASTPNCLGCMRGRTAEGVLP